MTRTETMAALQQVAADLNRLASPERSPFEQFEHLSLRAGLTVDYDIHDDAEASDVMDTLHCLEGTIVLVSGRAGSRWVALGQR